MFKNELGKYPTIYKSTLFNLASITGRIFWFKSNSGVTVNSAGIGQPGYVSSWVDQFGNGHTLTQGTAAKQPRYLEYAGNTAGINLKNYVFFPGTAGNNATTPSAVANQITGDIDIRVYAQLESWTTAQTLVSKMNGAGARSYKFGINGSGLFIFEWSANGTLITVANCTAAHGIQPNELKAIKVTLDVDNGSGVYEVRFYTSPDGGSTYNQLGLTVTGVATTSIFAGAAQLQISNAQDTLGQNLLGRIFNVNIRNGINGALVVSFNPDKGNMYNNSWVSTTTGETWTINTDAAAGYKAQLIDSTSIMFDGINDFMKTAAIAAQTQPYTLYLFCKRYTWVNNNGIIDGFTNGTGAIRDRTATPGLHQFAGNNGSVNNGFPLQSFRIITAIFNGGTSSIKIDQTAAAVTSIAGTNNAGGLSVGANATETNFSPILVKEIVCYSGAQSAALQTSIRRDIASRNHYTQV
jgi:hypothetical protein